MKQTLTITLSKEVKSELEQIAIDEGLTRSEVVRNALQDYLFIKRFRTLRNKMIAKAEAQGIFKDEDVFAKIS